MIEIYVFCVLHDGAQAMFTSFDEAANFAKQFNNKQGGNLEEYEDYYIYKRMLNPNFDEWYNRIYE